MSGEAGATHESIYYTIFVGTGLIVSIATPPGGDPHSGKYFERANAPYQLWLAAAAPELDRLFERFVVDNRLPLLPLAGDHADIFGVVIDDLAEGRRAVEDAAYERRNGARFFAENPGRGVRVQMSCAPNHAFGTVDLHIVLAAQVKRTELNQLRDELVKILTVTRPGA